MATKKAVAVVAAAAAAGVLATATLVTTSRSTRSDPPAAYCYRAAQPGDVPTCRPITDFPGATCPLGMIGVAFCPPEGVPVPTPIPGPPTPVPPTPRPTARPTAVPTPPPVPTVIVPPISGPPQPMPTAPPVVVPPISGEPPFTFPLPCSQTPYSYRIQWRADPLDYYFLDVVPGGRGATVEIENGAVILVTGPAAKSIPLNGTEWIAVTGAATAWVRNSSGSIIYPMQPIALQPCY